MKRIQKHLRGKTAQGKDCNRKKEGKLQQSNTREVWGGMRTITVYRLETRYCRRQRYG